MLVALDSYAKAGVPDFYYLPNSMPTHRGLTSAFPDLKLPGTVGDYRNSADTAGNWSAYEDAQNGMMPEAGGLLDQPAIWVDVVGACRNITNKLEARVAKKQRERMEAEQKRLKNGR